MTADRLGERILGLRTTRGLTQRSLAEPSYTAAYVSSVESGRRVPSAEALAYFAARLGVTAQELRTGESADADVRLDLDLALADATAGDDPYAVEAVYERVAAATDEPRRLAQCKIGLGHTALLRDRIDAASAYFDEADLMLSGAPPHHRVEAVAGRAACLRRRGDARYAAYLLIDIRDHLVGAGYPDPGALLAVHAQLAACHGELGDDDQSAVAASAALALAGPSDPGAIAGMHVSVARTLLDAGRLGDATRALEQARLARRQALLRLELAWCHRARGRARGRAGDLAGAVADLETAHRMLAGPGAGDDGLDAGIELAEAYVSIGRRDQAATLLDAVDAAGASGVRAARVHRVRALLAEVDRDLPAVERHLRDCVEGYRTVGPCRELASAVLRLADLLRGRGHRDQAAQLLHTALIDVEALTERGGLATADYLSAGTRAG